MSVVFYVNAGNQCMPSKCSVITVCVTISLRSIQNSSSCKATLRISSVVGVCLHIRQATYWCIHSSWGQARLLWHDRSHWSTTRRGSWPNNVPGSEVQRSPCAPSPPSRHHQPPLSPAAITQLRSLLTTKTDERNFIVRQLFSNMYWLIHWYSQLLLL